MARKRPSATESTRSTAYTMEEFRKEIVFRNHRWCLTAKGRRIQQAWEEDREAQEAAKLAAVKAEEERRQRRWQDAWNERERRRVKARERAERRRAYRLNAPLNDFTDAQWQRILLAWKHRCAYCGVQDFELTQDHVIPLSKGGSHTATNIVPACLSCNCSKGTRPAPPFVVIPDATILTTL